MQSGNGQLLAQLFLLLQTKKGSDPLLRVSASGCLPVLSMGYTPQGALWWRWASTHRETSSRQRAASICADSAAHERNSAQEVEQAEKKTEPEWKYYSIETNVVLTRYITEMQ